MVNGDKLAIGEQRTAAESIKDSWMDKLNKALKY